MKFEMPEFIYHIDNNIIYPDTPFNPDTNYPEFNNIFQHFDPSNSVYKIIRSLFIEAGYDKENIGTSKWNPFRGYIYNDQIVLIKPNFVYEETKDLIGKSCLITNGAVIRPIIDYLFLLQEMDGIKFRIIVADIPIQGADFNKIIKQSGIKALYDYYNENLPHGFEVYDLRHKIAVQENDGFFKTIDIQGDPLGYSKIHLDTSFLQEIVGDYRKFGAPGYGINETNSQLKESGNHYYHIPNTILKSNLFINIPKVKTHKKAGVTLAMKNLIGINGEKAWVPHYRRGSIKYGGDEYDDKQIFIKAISAKVNLFLQGRSRMLWIFAKKMNQVIIKKYFRKDKKIVLGQSELERKALFLLGGDWYGNNTLWRAILDLNYMLLYTDGNGSGTETKARNYICLNDGIIAGEGDGPLSPYPMKLGLLALSQNPVINDLCIAKIMGFDWVKIPQLKNSVQLKKYFKFDGDVKRIEIIGSANKVGYSRQDFENLPNFNFKAPPGWLDHIKITEKEKS